MTQKIIALVDGSIYSESVCHHAAWIARKTDAPVELAVGPQRVTAVGMVAYLLEERLQLQSEVHGRFLP